MMRVIVVDREEQSYIIYVRDMSSHIREWYYLGLLIHDARFAELKVVHRLLYFESSLTCCA